MPVADILRYHSLTWPDRVPLVAGDRRITFSVLDQAVWRLASAMSGLCGPGDRVGILAAPPLRRSGKRDLVSGDSESTETVRQARLA